MNVSILSILAGWIIFSTLLVSIILINSSRMSRTQIIQEIGPGQSTGELRKKRIELANLIKNVDPIELAGQRGYHETLVTSTGCSKSPLWVLGVSFSQQFTA